MAIDYVKIEAPSVMISSTCQHIPSPCHDTYWVHKNATLQPANISRSEERKKSVLRICWHDATMKDKECLRDGRRPMKYPKAYWDEEDPSLATCTSRTMDSLKRESRFVIFKTTISVTESPQTHEHLTIPRLKRNQQVRDWNLNTAHTTIGSDVQDKVSEQDY